MKKLPKNLNLKIGSKKESAWTQFKDEAEATLIQAELGVKVNKAMIELAEKEIKKEKDL